MWPEIQIAKNENRRELVLFGKQISERIFKDGLCTGLFDLSTLNFLDIHDTCLSNVPDDIIKLINLQSLLLHSNKIESINNSICRLKRLKLLDLSCNKLQTVPDNINNLPELTCLNLSCNELESFPKLEKNSKLAVLNLSNNKLTQFPNICHKEMCSLSEVHLKNNHIEEISQDIEILAALKVLDLSSNKINTIPGEICGCSKLKDVHLNDNPITDKRLLKLIDQCRTKQVVDYIKAHCSKSQAKGKSATTTLKFSAEEDNHLQSVDMIGKNTINVLHARDDMEIIIKDDVKGVRPHIVACIVRDVQFTAENMKKFIQLQTKLHDSACEKRNAATIATHDLKKVGNGNLIYTGLQPQVLKIKPLNCQHFLSGVQLYTKLRDEAEVIRKEKKRNNLSGVHRYLYLLEGKSKYACLLNAKEEVISFPPITNSDTSKMDIDSTDLLLEITSTVSQQICKTIMDHLLREMVTLFNTSLTVQQVKIVDIEGNLKLVYPSRTDLQFQEDANIFIKRT